MQAFRQFKRAVSLPFVKSAILSAPAQTSSITAIFAGGIVDILERDGCDEVLYFCDGDDDLDGFIDGLIIGC